MDTTKTREDITIYQNIERMLKDIINIKRMLQNTNNIKWMYKIPQILERM